MRLTVYLLVSVIAASAGQLFFKKGVLNSGNIALNGQTIENLMKLILSPSILFGLTLYLFSTILWLIALSKTTLNYAYPFTALTFVLVMLSSRVIFNETIPYLRYVGTFLIIVGVILSSMGER